MKAGGQITVFISLILVCILALICGLLESARMAGARYYLQISAVSSLDSVMSQYYRPLWDQYRIFGLAYSEEAAIENEFMRFLQYYSETDNWYPMEPERVSLKDTVHLTDGNGQYLEAEILDFMRYGIWTQGPDTDLILETEAAVREAKSVNEVSKQMEGQSKAAWEIERILEELQETLKQQENFCREAGEALNSGDGQEFWKASEKLVGCLERVPKLVEEYGEKADRLGRQMEEVKTDYEKRQGDISGNMQEIIDREFQRYDTYTEEDGERRMEVESLTELAYQQKELVLEAMEAAAEVEIQIRQWESAEEEGELDEDALWDSVRNIFSNYQILELTCSLGGEDRESEGILNRIRRGADSALLEMVLPENTEVSEVILPKSGLPSDERMDGEGDMQRESRVSGVNGVADKVLYIEYCEKFFGDFCNKEEGKLQYALEYLIHGNRIDQRNLADCVKQLLAVREGLNFIAILTDSQKRQEAEGLAAAMVGGTGFLPLIGITAFFIMGIWALGEALVDVKTLLSGGNVPIWKNSSSWNLSLEGLLDIGRNGTVPLGKNDEGVNYTGYLKFFLFLMPVDTVDYRMMDLIQTRLAEDTPGFRMDQCAYQVDIMVEVCGKHVFSSLELLKSVFGTGRKTYLYSTEVCKAY